MLRLAAAFRAQSASSVSQHIATASAASAAAATVAAAATAAGWRSQRHAESTSTMHLFRSSSSLCSRSFLSHNSLHRASSALAAASLPSPAPSRAIHSSSRAIHAPLGATTKKPRSKPTQPIKPVKLVASRSRAAKAAAIDNDPLAAADDSDLRGSRRSQCPLSIAPSAVGLTPTQLRSPQIHVTDMLSLRSIQGGLPSSSATEASEDAAEQMERMRSAGAAGDGVFPQSPPTPKRLRVRRRSIQPCTTRDWNGEISMRLAGLFSRLMTVRQGATAKARAAAAAAARDAPAAKGKQRKRPGGPRPFPVPTESAPVPLARWGAHMMASQLIGDMGLLEQRCRDELCALDMTALLRRFERGVLERQRYETRPQQQSHTLDDDAATEEEEAAATASGEATEHATPKPKSAQSQGPDPSPWMYWTLDDWRDFAAREREEIAKMQQREQQQPLGSDSASEPLFPPPSTPFDLPSAIATHARATRSSTLPASFASPGAGSDWPLLFMSGEPYLLHHHRARLGRAMEQRKHLERVLQQERERQLVFRPNPLPAELARRSAEYRAAHAAAKPSLARFGDAEVRIDRLLDHVEREELRIAMLASSALLLLETEARLFDAHNIEPVLRKIEEERAAQLSEAARSQVIKLRQAQERKESVSAAREAARAAEIRARVYVSESGVVQATPSQLKAEARKAAEEQRRILAMQPVATGAENAEGSGATPAAPKTEAESIAEAVAAAALPSFLPLPVSSPPPPDEPALFSLFTVVGEPLGLPRRAEMLEQMSAETRHTRMRQMRVVGAELRPTPAIVGGDRTLMGNVRGSLFDSVFRLSMAEAGVREYLRQVADRSGGKSFEQIIEERKAWIAAHPEEYAAQRAVQSEAKAELKRTSAMETEEEETATEDPSAPANSKAKSASRRRHPIVRPSTSFNSVINESTRQIDLYLRTMPAHAADCFLAFEQRDILATITRMMLPDPAVTRLLVEMRESQSDEDRLRLSEELTKAGTAQWSAERGCESFHAWPLTISSTLHAHALQLEDAKPTEDEQRVLRLADQGGAAATRSAAELEQEQALLRLEQALFFEHHISQFNPALRARVEAAASSETEPAGDRYSFSYLQRPSPFQCGGVALPRILSRFLFPLLALHAPSSHVVRILPLSMWEMWRQLCLSLFLRLRPQAFAPWRVPRAQLPPSESPTEPEIAALRGHRLPVHEVAHVGSVRLGDLVFVDSIDAQGKVVAAAAEESASAASATVDAVPSVFRSLPARVTRGRPKSAPTSTTVADRRVAAQTRPKAPARPEGLVDESRAGLEYARAMHNFKAQTKEARLLRALNRLRIEAEAKAAALEEAQRSLEAQAGGALFTAASLDTMRSALSALHARIATSQALLDKLRANVAPSWSAFVLGWEQRHKEWQWRLSRQIGPFVTEAVQREFQALAATYKKRGTGAATKKQQQQQLESTPTSAITEAAAAPEDGSSSSAAVVASAPSVISLTLPRLYTLLHTVAAVPDLESELAHLPSVEDRLSDAISVEQLQRRLGELRKPRHNFNVFPIESVRKESDETTAAAAAADSSSSSLIPASSAAPPPAAPPSTSPSYLMVMTDLSTEQLKLIREGIAEMCARCGIASCHLVSDRHAGVVHPSTSTWRTAVGGGGSNPSVFESASSDASHVDPWLVMQFGPMELHAFSGAESFSSVDAISKQHGGVALQLGPALPHEKLLGHSHAPLSNPLKAIQVNKLHIIAHNG